MRTVALASLLSLLALTGGQHVLPRAAVATETVVLSKTNVLRGKTTGYTRVSLRTSAVLDYGALAPIKGKFPRLFRKQGPSPSLEVSGRGDFIGIAMTPDRDGADPLFVSGQFRGQGTADKVVNFTSPFYGRRIRLSPGTYRVYLIADGYPAEVRFTFNRGVSGTTRFAPQTVIDSTAQTAADFMRLGEAGAKYSVNEHVVESGRALTAVGMLLVHGGQEVGEGMGVCIKNLDGAAPGYFGPRCGNGFDKVFVAEVQGRADTYFITLEDQGVTRGRWGFGGWYAGDARPESVSLHSLTVDRN